MENDSIKDDKNKSWPQLYLSTKERTDLRDAFNMFDIGGKGVVSGDIVKIALRVLGYEVTLRDCESLSEVILNLSDGVNEIDLRNFEILMEKKMLIKDKKIDIEKSFQLMLDIDERGKTEIDVDHLRKVAEYLGEEITEEEIEEMIEMVSGDKASGVSLSDFITIMTMTEKPKFE